MFPGRRLKECTLGARKCVAAVITRAHNTDSCLPRPPLHCLQTQKCIIAAAVGQPPLSPGGVERLGPPFVNSPVPRHTH
eukprot:5850796-Pyramimonas_sp.AAC.1